MNDDYLISWPWLFQSRRRRGECRQQLVKWRSCNTRNRVPLLLPRGVRVNAFQLDHVCVRCTGGAGIDGEHAHPTRSRVPAMPQPTNISTLNDTTNTTRQRHDSYITSRRCRPTGASDARATLQARVRHTYATMTNCKSGVTAIERTLGSTGERNVWTICPVAVLHISTVPS